MDLSGKVALVTGAQQGIGRAAAIALAAAGADVAINYLDDLGAATSVAEAIHALGRRAMPVQANVAMVADTRAMVAKVIDTWGRLDILVNNAGIFPRSPFLEMQEAEWDQILGINLKGTAFTAQAAAKAMVAAGTGGAIINLASSAVRGSPNGAHYSASKGGIVSLTRTMALELAPHGIRVNALAPGLTDTAQPRYGNDEAQLRSMAALIPLGRMGRPQEMGDIITFLASDKASFVTGQILHANGGAYMP